MAKNSNYHYKENREAAKKQALQDQQHGGRKPPRYGRNPGQIWCLIVWCLFLFLNFNEYLYIYNAMQDAGLAFKEFFIIPSAVLSCLGAAMLLSTYVIHKVPNWEDRKHYYIATLIAFIVLTPTMYWSFLHFNADIAAVVDNFAGNDPGIYSVVCAGVIEISMYYRDRRLTSFGK